MHAPSSVQVFDLAQVLPGRFAFGTRMSALPLAGGGLALVSPIPIDDDLARRIAELGEVRLLIAPNLLHHLHLGAAAQRYPHARVIAPASLARKRPDLRIDVTFDQPLPRDLIDAVDVLPIEGAPTIDEYLFFHRASRSLVTTDLVFNVQRPKGVTAHVVLFCVGCHGRFAQSRMWRRFVKDRSAAAASLERVLALPIETLIMAHGDVVTDRAGERLANAVRWVCPHPQAARANAPASSA